MPIPRKWRAEAVKTRRGLGRQNAAHLGQVCDAFEHKAEAMRSRLRKSGGRGAKPAGVEAEDVSDVVMPVVGPCQRLVVVSAEISVDLVPHDGR